MSMTTKLHLPFSDSLRAQVQSGDEAAILRALVCLAAVWIEAGGASVDDYHSIGPTTCVAHQNPRSGALLAAGLDVLRVLNLSPQGRKAVADFCGKPFLQQTKGE